ncbi:cytochrome P450 [Rheinheimera maricola]|uniref:Cytochrome P450 n=1 Tax=Rheinheimera maricola TaxID=2793282 RepID=A0ABS7X469_9GAMM|nr:cytochrome P450 [Rheinheimera maricola]MBZ9610339.1 cytochrome P450 [Rheinheimera maricola]
MLTSRKFIPVTAADKCREVLKSPQITVINMSDMLTQISQVTGKSYPWLRAYACESPFNLEGQQHKVTRRMLASFFSSKRINSWASVFRQVVTKVVVATLEKKQIDLQADWVGPITAQCTFYALGLEPNIEPLLDVHIDQLLLLTVFERQLKIRDFDAFDSSAQHIAKAIYNNRIVQTDYTREAVPEDVTLTDNDLYNYLACQFGLSANQICSYMTVLLVAGASTKHTLANVLVTLLTLAPDKRAELTLRFEKSELLERVLYSSGGVEFIYRMLNGEDVYCLNIAEANKQLTTCPFSATDKPTAAHLAFGYGPHKCIGEMLSRLIMVIALEVVLDHCPNASIKKTLTSQVFTHTPAQNITVEL